MRISELIESLTKIQATQGDVHVMVIDGDETYPIGPKSIHADAEYDGTTEPGVGDGPAVAVALTDLTASPNVEVLLRPSPEGT